MHAHRSEAFPEYVARTEALHMFDALGAPAAATELRRLLRVAGAKRVPRGPISATRRNPFGLTPRQADVLALLVEDLSNSEIAGRLSLTPKTIDHHVGAVLAKLDVPSRKAAA